jgi:hypothetical protein
VKHAGKVFFLLDEHWGLTRSVYSPEMSRQMVWLSGLLPYEQASQVFARFGYSIVPSVSLWRQTQSYGEKMRNYVEQQQEVVSVTKLKLLPPGCDHQRRKGISMDGGMVNIRGEGWKEMKVGTVFDVALHLERDTRTGELAERPHAQSVTYTAVLGSVDQFAPALWALAVQQGVPQAADSSVIADGANWIWNLADDYFPDSKQTVDWYHACEHLAKSAHALFSDDPHTARQWYTQNQETLFLGNCHLIISELETAGLETYSHYFHTHKRRMQYLEFLEEGYPIGSGTVESSIKQFKIRLTGPGMRWSRPGAERMLVIRAAVMADTFDDLWAAAA